MTPDKLHHHLIVRADINKPPFEDDCEYMEEWFSDLIASIGMKELAAPRARYCDVKGNRGMTVDAIIETSHLVCHTWDEGPTPVLQFDLYSCSSFDPKAIIDNIYLTFEASRIAYKFLDREHDLTLIDQDELLITAIENAEKMISNSLAHFWNKEPQ